MADVNVKSAQHRPGPWWAGLEYDGDSGAYFVHHNGHPIADCNMGYGLEDEANARLIAAAPELLEACRDVESKIVDYETGRINWRPDDFLVRVRAAIAKAEAR